MLKNIHPIAGAAAVLVIAVFWLSTVAVELFGSTAHVVLVKTTIPWGFLVLIPALAIAGGTGSLLSHGAKGGLVGRKLRRMPVIAANGILVLIPSALYLSHKAGEGDFDSVFYAVQALELCAGAVNIFLMGLNVRDGRRLSAGKRRKSVIHKQRV
jgi:hypothetical protein